MIRRIIAVIMTLALTAALLAWPSESVEVQAAGGDYVDVSDKNLLLFNIKTGPNAGTGVVCIGVEYIDTFGIPRTEYIYPNDGAVSETAKMMETLTGGTSPAQKKAEIMKKYGVSVGDYASTEPLQPNSTDYYLMTTTYPLDSLKGITVVMDKDTIWSCTRMDLYSVTKLGLMDMMGYYSGEYFLDFEGNQLGYILPTGGSIYSDGGSVQYFRVGTMNGGGKIYDSRDVCPTVSVAPEYMFKLDIAGSSGAGVDGFIQDALSCLKLNDTKGIGAYKECLTMNISYTGTDNMAYSFSVPVMLAELCYLNYEKNMGQQLVYGLGQIGESIVFPVTLPACSDEMLKDNRVDVKFYYSTEYATEKCGLSYSGSKKSVSGGEVKLSGAQIINSPVGVNVKNYCLEHVIDNNNIVSYHTAVSSTGDNLSYFKDIAQAANYAQKINFNAFTEGSVLVNHNVSDIYVCEIDVDAVKNAETDNNIQITFTYEKVNGKTATTNKFDLRTAVNEYYGNWAMNPDGSSAYDFLNAPGGKMLFMFSASDVSRFISATITVGTDKPEDDFQFSSITVRGVDKEATGSSTGTLNYNFGNERINSKGVKTKWAIERDITLLDGVYGGYSEKTMLEPDGLGTTITFGIVQDVEKEKDIDWTKYYSSMTYADTEQDMGYSKIRTTYLVTVKVAEDMNNASTDAGSKNQFYFQLIFANGEKSAYVLANQQLESDGFRSGQTEKFKIYSNYDYGDVAGIMIIPDSQQENSNIYDKLKLDYVQIQRLSSDMTIRTWKCDINNWIGIDYNDSGAASSSQGQNGRSEGEIARMFSVTKTGSAVNLLIELPVIGYSGTPQLTGTMRYRLGYIDQDNRTQVIDGDAYDAIYDYIGVNATYAAADSTGRRKAVIDQNYMMRAGQTNYFTIAVSDIKSVSYINFYIVGDYGVETQLTLGNVRISRIVGGSGTYYLNEDGMRVRNYKSVLLSELGDNHRENTIVVKGDSNGTEYYFGDNLYFVQDDRNVIALTDLGEWESVIGQVPQTQEDYMFIYLHRAGEEDYQWAIMPAKPSQYSIGIKLRYRIDTAVQSNMPMTQEVMNLPYDADSGMYCTVLSASGLVDIDGLIVTAYDKTGMYELDPFTNVFFDYGVIERIRGDVVVESYNINFMTLGEPTDITALVENTSFAALPNSGEQAEAGKVKVIMSIGPNSQSAKLFRNEENKQYCDLGIALEYESDIIRNVFKKEDVLFSTTTKFVSQNGYDSIQPHQVYEMTFTPGNVFGIKAVRMVSQGLEELDVEAMAVMVYDKDDNILLKYSYTGSNSGFDVEDNYTSIALDASDQTPIGFMTLKFKTAEASEKYEDPSATGPIDAIISWKKTNGGESYLEIHDLSEYVLDGNFEAGNTATVCVAMKDFANIQTVQLEPVNSDRESGLMATWTLESIEYTIKTNENANDISKTRTLNKTIVERRDKDPYSEGYTSPYRINLTPIQFATRVQYMLEENEAPLVNFYSTQEESIRTVTADPNSTVIMAAVDKQFIQGSFNDVDVKVEKIIEGNREPISGLLTLYSQDENVTWETSGSRSDNGHNLTKLEFYASNDTTSTVNYIITFISQEFNEKTFTIKVTVLGQPEPEPEPEREPEPGPLPVIDNDPVVGPEEQTGETTDVTEPEQQTEEETAEAGESTETEEETAEAGESTETEEETAEAGESTETEEETAEAGESTETTEETEEDNSVKGEET